MRDGVQEWDEVQEWDRVEEWDGKRHCMGPTSGQARQIGVGITTPI